MPEVLIPAELKGKKGMKEIIMLANSGSDYTILPTSIANEIGPKKLGRKIELKVGGGGMVKGELCLIEIKVRDPESKEERSEEVEAIILKGQDEPLAGISTLEKLGILLDMKNGKFKFV